MSHRHRRHPSCGSHGTNMLSFDCRLDPVRLTEYLQGTRRSEPKKKEMTNHPRRGCLVKTRRRHGRRHVLSFWGPLTFCSPRN